jgi:release factor glutamine methyltransferase
LNISQALAQSGLEPREARLLLAEAGGLSPASLIGFPERELPAQTESCFVAYVRRRLAGEPIAYILGHKEFYGLDLEVNAAVLVPRPETELLLELALARDFASAVDLGTGSGAVAIALKRARPRASVAAVECSSTALAVARRNAARHGVDIRFMQGSWFAPLGPECFDLILANPPYVRLGDPHLHDLRFEPGEALVSGADGLDAIREITAQATQHLRPGGWLFLEHGVGQDIAVRELLDRAGLESVSSWPDLAGIARVSGGKR